MLDCMLLSLYRTKVHVRFEQYRDLIHEEAFALLKLPAGWTIHWVTF